MKAPCSRLAIIMFLAGCSSHEHGADSGGEMRDASSHEDAGSFSHVDAGAGTPDGGAALHDASAPGSSSTSDASHGRHAAPDSGTGIADGSSPGPSSSPDQPDAQSSCPVVQGIFLPVYTMVSGNCGPINKPFTVPFDGGIRGVNTIIQQLGNAVVTTDIVIKGCSVHMMQTVADTMGKPQFAINGPDLNIESASRISGQVAIERFNPNSQLVCNGIYDAVFSQ